METKTCQRCVLDLSLDNFNWRKKYNKFCKICLSDIEKAYKILKDNVERAKDNAAKATDEETRAKYEEEEREQINISIKFLEDIYF